MGEFKSTTEVNRVFLKKNVVKVFNILKRSDMDLDQALTVLFHTAALVIRDEPNRYEIAQGASTFIQAIIKERDDNQTK